MSVFGVVILRPGSPDTDGGRYILGEGVIVSDNWFYTHAGASHGPVSTERLLGLVGTGGLLPDDMIWPESVPATAAIRAEAALTFPSPAPAVPMAFPVQPSPLPEWVRALTNAGVDVPTLESLANPPARAWLDDVRRLEQARRRPLNPAAAEGAPPPPWPVSQDYNEAVQSPATNFADADLRSGHAVTSALGIPQPCSGNFADVYQVGRPDGLRWAVKCFTRQATGLRERYQEISRHLRRARLRFMVDFTYLEQGVRVVGQWRPVLKMEWVQGLTLHQYVGEYADDPARLEALFQVWRSLSRSLRAAKVGHGDLQHGNVLLAPGADAHSVRLKLIDYDGMWVPALANRHSGEVGHPAYQHPLRIRDRTYSPEVDRFPLLLIAAALRAVKVGGRKLWEKYDAGDNLLFRRDDLEAPTKSPLFHDLVRSSEPVTAMLADHLLRALRGDVASAPLLEEVLP